jgi:hypothetical protein
MYLVFLFIVVRFQVYLGCDILLCFVLFAVVSPSWKQIWNSIKHYSWSTNTSHCVYVLIKIDLFVPTKVGTDTTQDVTWGSAFPGLVSFCINNCSLVSLILTTSSPQYQPKVSYMWSQLWIFFISSLYC